MITRITAILTAAALLAIAWGQALAPVGAMTGTIDGTAFELVVSEGQVEGVTVSNAYWNRSFMGGLEVAIIGQGRPSLFSFTPGAMLLDFVLAGSAWDCPCEIDDVSVFYSPEGGFVSNVYLQLEADATVDTIEELEPGVYRITGTFRSILGLKEGLMDRPDPERTVRIEGSFSVERLAEEEEVP